MELLGKGVKELIFYGENPPKSEFLLCPSTGNVTPGHFSESPVAVLGLRRGTKTFPERPRRDGMEQELNGNKAGIKWEQSRYKAGINWE